MKYFFALIILVLAIILIFVFQAKNRETFYGLKTVSNLNMEGKMGQENIPSDTTRPTVLIWFHPECFNCRYQLDVINDNIRRLDSARFLFITPEKDFFKKKFSSAWPELVKSSNALFGIIEKSRFIDEFGPVVTPSLLFFNQRGILKEKLYGEVKVEKIVYLIKNNSVPEQTISGSN